MKRTINGALLLLMSFLELFSGCGKDPVDPSVIITDPDVQVGDVVIYTRVGSPDGTDGAGWLQLTDGVSPKKLTNKNALQVPWGAPPIYEKNEIYTLPDFTPTGSLNMIKWKRENGKLVKSGEMELPAQSYAMGIAFSSPTKAYLSTWLGKLIIFNPQTMTTTGEIDLTSYAAEGTTVPLFGGLFLHDNLLYVPLIQVNKSYMPVTEPAVEIAVIDTRTEKVKKVIYERTSGLSGGPYQYSEHTFIDEKGDIYMMCSGNYGMNPKYKTGFLRMKKGESEFDPEYRWVLNDQDITGDPNKGVWLEVIAYGGNGKVYGLMDIPAYRKNPAMPNWFSDRSVIAVEMDLYAQTMKKLDIPLSMSIAPVVDKYKGLIVFGNMSEHENGFYTYDPKTGETSKEAVIKVTGQPVGFHYFGH